MNKKTLKALFVGAMLFASAMAAQANETFVVCSNTFDLVGSYPTGVTSYEWYDFGGTTIVNTTSTYSVSTVTPSTSAQKIQYVTRGYNGSCWSEYDTITVYVLPALSTTITAENSFGCDNNFSDSLTATTDLTSLDWTVMGGQNGIDIGNYTWSGGAGTAYGAHDSIYVVTQAGTYLATVGYDVSTLPSTINGVTVDGHKVDCTSDAATGVTITTSTAPNAPTVTIQ